MSLRLSTICFTILFITALASAANYDDQIKKNLDSAKSNRSQLEKAIKYFEKKGDSLQLDAIKYLIANMDGHAHPKVVLFDSNKKEIKFNILDYANFDSAQKAINALGKKHPGLHFDRKKIEIDLQTIKAKFLIRNVELAFEVWKTRPWSKAIPYENFRDYILPYRGGHEPLEDWRPYFIKRYKDLATTMKDSTDPIEAATLINRELMKWYHFDPRYYLHPTDLGLAEMLKTKLGRCGDMTNLTIYAVRANGIAVTSDYTPYWANTGNNHAWNSVLDKSGKAIPFMGCEADPRAYKLSGRIGKAYRTLYGHKTDNLSSKLNKDERGPAWLSGRDYMDVTKDYTDVSDMLLTLSDSIPAAARFAYLCVFNDGMWKPIHWAELHGKNARFSDMGRGVMYVPAFYYKKKVEKDTVKRAQLEPTGDAFLLQIDGTLRWFAGDTNKRMKVELWSTTKKIFANATEGKRIAALDTGAKYELFYWNKDWISLGKKTFTDKTKPLVFDSVPADRLYWLVKDDDRDMEDREERIFTIDDGKQVWW